MIGQYQSAELQACTYSITREKAPIYTMGSADCRAYSRNKRGIAGSLIWINFDRHALLNLFFKARGKFVADKDEIRPQFQDLSDQSAIFSSSLVRSAGPSIGATIDQLDNLTLKSRSLPSSARKIPHARVRGGRPLLAQEGFCLTMGRVRNSRIAVFTVVRNRQKTGELMLDEE